MSFHHNLQEWLRMSAADGCPVCQEQPEPEGLITIAEFPTSWLQASPRVCLRGTCVLVARPHVVEMWDFSQHELLAYMTEAQKSAKVLKEVTGAVKINYEIHGNTVPHLHMHLFPRYVDDPFPGGPIDFRRVEPAAYHEGEFSEFVSSMRDTLRD